MIRLTLAVLIAVLFAIAAHAQGVPSARPPTLGVGTTDGSGSCNTGTQQAVNNIAPQACVQGYGVNHTVALGDGILNYAANAGSSITFTLARATAGDGAQGVGYCFADWTHHGYTLATTTSTFTGSAGVSGSSQAFPADTFVCAQSDGADHWTLEVVWGDMIHSAIPEPVTWVPGINPNNIPIFRANTIRTITAIVCRPEVATGGTATVTVVKAPSGTAISAGTPLHSGSCNANGTAATDQTLTLVGGATDVLAPGDTIGIKTTGTTIWTSSGVATGVVTVYMQ